MKINANKALHRTAIPLRSIATGELYVEPLSDPPVLREILFGEECMSDVLKKHRVIGIRHTLKEMKGAGLISENVMYPSHAVEQLQKTKTKAQIKGVRLL